ncbi:hypothetical protein DERF_000547 [Dermatophagoides farinae]|uniref:Uncharacterized protein n=1 Tax=Dermatophagoides farinae TaxID=6954 RepID=A0A922I6T1_DERFA|nr:hypothetical protein DERF_000547 [Dermatophagoides farinae]
MFLLVIDCGYLDYRQSYHQILLLLLFISSFFSFKFCINSFTCSPSSDAIRYFSKHFVSSIEHRWLYNHLNHWLLNHQMNSI